MKIEGCFKNKKINQEKLLNFGFKKENDGFKIKKLIVDGLFELSVFIKKDAIKTRLIEVETGELYSLHLIDGADGNFVGQVKFEFNNFLSDIVEKCFEPDVFKNKITLELIEYIKEKYNSDIEFLWEKFAGNAVARRQDNKKWYIIFLTIPKTKLGLKDSSTVEIIDLRAENVEEIIDNKAIFSGYHMNKKHWITILLNGSISTNEIKQRIDTSYILAKGKKKA